MTPSSPNSPQAAPGQVAARVIALEGHWACLWMPQTGQTAWVDLNELDYQVAGAPS